MRVYFRVFFIAAFLLVCVLSNTYSQESTERKIPAEVTEYMSRTFPKVKNMKYFYSQGSYMCTVIFNLNDTYMEMRMVKSHDPGNDIYIAQSLLQTIPIKRLPKAVKNQIENSIVTSAHKETHYIRFDGNKRIDCNIVHYVVKVLNYCEASGACEDEVLYAPNGDVISKLIPI